MAKADEIEDIDYNSVSSPITKPPPSEPKDENKTKVKEQENLTASGFFSTATGLLLSKQERKSFWFFVRGLFKPK